MPRHFLAARPAVRVVDLLLPDLCGVLRGKRVDRSDLARHLSAGHFLPGSMFALDVLGGTIQTTGLGFDEGDADRACVPVRKDSRPRPRGWARASRSSRCRCSTTTAGLSTATRATLLDAVLDRYAARGWTPVIAVELEFYFVDVRSAPPTATPSRPALRYTGRRETRTQINSMADLESVSDILTEIAATCEAQGVPTGAALAECGPNQWEVNLRHVADARLACDQAIRFKRIVKGVAHRNGLEATFMAKPYADMRRAAECTCMRACWTAKGRNIFAFR